MSVFNPIIKYIIIAFSSLLALGGLIGLIVHGSFSADGGPIYIKSEYIGMWLSAFLIFYSTQTLFIILYQDQDNNSNGLRCLYSDSVIYSIGMAGGLIMTICYGLVEKNWETVWSFFIFVASLMNTVFIWLIERKTIKENEQSNNEKEIVLTTGAGADTGALNQENKPEKKEVEENKEAVITEDKEYKSEKQKKIIIHLNGLVKYLVTIILILLVNGSIRIGGYSVAYPKRGKIADVKLNDGTSRLVKLHYKCENTDANSSKPVFMFEGSGSHGYMDYLAIQIELKNLNIASCIWDKLGLGYSDYLFYYNNSTTSVNEMLYYHNFILEMKLTQPLFFVGWGGGANTIFKYASIHPEMVKSIILLDGGPSEEAVEKEKNRIRGTSDAKVEIDINSRYSLFSLINGLGVPWGLMPIFFSEASVEKSITFPKELIGETNWFFYTDKTWITQLIYLKGGSVTFNYANKISNSIPISNIYTAYTDEIIKKKECTDQKIDLASVECNYRFLLQKFIKEEKLKISQTNPKGKAIQCSKEECDLGYYVYKDPKFTATQLSVFVE